jgi:hypothetical protein
MRICEGSCISTRRVSVLRHEMGCAKNVGQRRSRRRHGLYRRGVEVAVGPDKNQPRFSKFTWFAVFYLSPWKRRTLSAALNKIDRT